MWFIYFLTLLVAGSLSVNVFVKYSKEWSQFKSQYKKTYFDDIDELKHYKIFVQNERRIQEHNKLYDIGRVTYKQRINKFSDMTHKDVIDKMTGHIPSNSSIAVKYRRKKRENFLTAESKDWRNDGYVTRVKDQECCKSCWAFSATGVLEGQHFKKTGELVSLSEQNLIDCTEHSDCSGGYMTQAFKYVMDNGINSEESYPYEKKNLSCRHNSNKNLLKVQIFYTLSTGDEMALLDKLSTYGPISVAIDASLESFDNYGEGIYEDSQCSSSKLNHDVLLVGYGSERGRDYWILKNSWGTSWGEKGYIRIARNKNNMCGIATRALIAEI